MFQGLIDQFLEDPLSRVIIGLIFAVGILQFIFMANQSASLVLTGLIAVLAIMLLLRSVSRFTRRFSTGDKVLAQYAYLITLHRNDPNFDIRNFTSRVNNIFLKYLDSWTKKNLDMIRPYETAEMFGMHKKELQPFIENMRTRMIADLSILDTQISTYTEDKTEDILDVTIKACFKSFVIDDNSRKVVDGSQNTKVRTGYLLRMVRNKGVHTRKDAKPDKVIQCPNCGADVGINALGKCEHCGTELTMEQCDWALAGVALLK